MTANHATEDAQRRKAGDQARDAFAELAARGPGGSWETGGGALWAARLALAAGWPDDETLAELEAIATATGRGKEARGFARRTLANARREGAADLPRLSREELHAGGLRAAPTKPQPKPAPKKPTPPAPVRPPWGELGALLDRCGPVEADPQVAGWLAGRGIDPAAVELGKVPAVALPTGGALPTGAACPGWARGPMPDGSGWGPWSVAGYRLLLPLWDPNGYPRSVVARSVVPRPDDAPRTLPPVPNNGTRYNRAGLLLANVAAVELLRAPAPTPWVVVVEGEPDWLSFAAALPDVPVLGVAAGAWRKAFALRFPGAAWWLATDDNEAGDRYAHGIAATLPPGSTVYRCRAPLLWPEGEAPDKAPDWNDALQARLWTPDPEGTQAALTATAERYAPPKDRP
jgi:hypothetical protein